MRRSAVSFSGWGDYPRTALGPHASRVLPLTTRNPGNTALGALASSVLLPRAKVSAHNGL
jgi:hypothetical protein